MDRRAWWATVSGVTKANITEKVIHTQSSFILLRKASENLGVRIEGRHFWE